MEIQTTSLLASVGLFFMALAFFVLFILSLVWRLRKEGRYAPFTENMWRLPAHSLRIKKSELSDDFTGSYVFFIGFSVGIIISVVFLEETKMWTLFTISFIGLVYTFWRMQRQFTALHQYGLGCEGEEYTGQELNLLMRKGAYVFHDIPYQYGNIDHVVIGYERILVVETKTVRKPKKSGTEASREFNVQFDGTTLLFPHFRTTDPIEQAKVHTAHISKSIKKFLDVDFPVVPVVALPGWHIELKNSATPEILIINPKRGRALEKWLGKPQSHPEHKRVVSYLASVAQSVNPRSNKTDPDASKKYDIWLNPRYKEKQLGEI